MKLNLKRIIIALTVSSAVFASSCSAAVTAEVSAFSDVPESYWGYSVIMDMTEKGLFNGTSEPVNGVGTFSPESAMTRAEFITVALRTIFPDEAGKVVNGSENWWDGYYALALECGIVYDGELDGGRLGEPMTREEMAMIMVRCVKINGESLTGVISPLQIADYDRIDSYYQQYVVECFSFGLLCGVDENGTFAPDKSLTRAEAATALCRLIDKDMRIKAELFGGSEEVYEKPELPWENVGKQPSEYTWAEYESLSEDEKTEFFKSFESNELFDEWMNSAINAILPWKNGGKQPNEYTWEEFEALSGVEQMAFQKSFGDIEKFDEWLTKAQGNVGSNFLENGGKQPSEYTWEEFEALSGVEQMEFQKSFGDIEKFDEWLTKAQGNVGSNFFEKGGKKPSEYTWEEFEALSGVEQIEFQNSFDSDEERDRWFAENMPG